MNLKRFAAAIALAVTSVVGVAEAKTVAPAPVQCMFGTQAQWTATADVWTSTACYNEISGNDSDQTGGNGVVNVNTVNGGLFGYTNWTLNSRYDANGSYSPNGVLSISNLNGLMSGTWSVSSWSGIGAAMLVLKGSNGFASYLLDITAGTTGQWSVQALLNNGGQTPNMSHISLYTVPATVPLPAAGLLLVGGLGAMAALRRKARKSA